MPQKIPVTYQEISTALTSQGQTNPFLLRRQTLSAIEDITKIPLICYVSKTSNVPRGAPIFIDEEDVIGFSDLITTTPGEKIDVFLISNGGSPEAAERIVKLLRNKYRQIRFFIAGNAYSAATMMCFAADEIIMHCQGTLGPIDPQISGIPAHAILESFEEVQKRLKDEGPASLTAYMPLIAKNDLHLLNLCKKAQQLSIELAEQYLRQYMKKDDKSIKIITDFFMDHETHKSHGRSIDRESAKEKGLNIVLSESIRTKETESDEFDKLLLSLFNQYQFFFGISHFCKLYENTRGINWGKSIQPQQVQIPIPFPNIPTQFPKP
jgi:ClpP class serine protease